MLDSIYHMTSKLIKAHFWAVKVNILTFLRNVMIDV